jgi:hypothetical protein
VHEYVIVAKLPGKISAWAGRLGRERFTRLAWVVVVLMVSAATVWASAIAQPTSSTSSFWTLLWD